MKFWKLLASLWRSHGSTERRPRRSRHVRIMDSLNESDRLEDRSALRTLYPDLDLTGLPHVEAVRVAGQREQTVPLQRRLLRLSVAIVDYLLEHEWYSLLGRTRRRSGAPRERGGPRNALRLVAADDAPDPSDEPNRTACVHKAPWSIVAAIEQPPDSGSTNSTDE